MSAERKNMKEMYDELMGYNNLVATKKLNFSILKCAKHLLDCCPHDYLRVVRSKVLDCRFTHSVLAREEYRNHPKRDNFNYEKIAYKMLDDIVNGADRAYQSNIDKCLLKKKKENEKISKNVNFITDAQCYVICNTWCYILILVNANLLDYDGHKYDESESVSSIHTQIDVMTSQAEYERECGNVFAAKRIMEEVEKLTDKKNLDPIKNRMKKSDVAKSGKYGGCVQLEGDDTDNYGACDVCGIYINSLYFDNRRQQHLNGKYHIAFVTLRAKLKDLKIRCDEVMKRLHEKATKKLAWHIIKLGYYNSICPMLEKRHFPIINNFPGTCIYKTKYRCNNNVKNIDDKKIITHLPHYKIEPKKKYVNLDWTSKRRNKKNSAGTKSPVIKKPKLRPCISSKKEWVIHCNEKNRCTLKTKWDSTHYATKSNFYINKQNLYEKCDNGEVKLPLQSNKKCLNFYKSSEYSKNFFKTSCTVPIAFGRRNLLNDTFDILNYIQKKTITNKEFYDKISKEKMKKENEYCVQIVLDLKHWKPSEILLPNSHIHVLKNRIIQSSRKVES
ncbi:hypothetical protein A3Q56_03503 [Intoshia linei]|uniref:Uncharacterized protein n=1 Tax=Intoshia linei TaxID=1819745 RepID=A0A177B4V6_9BILA|nr:hypothetical protein A3Q56_03503 [Intoshia linei]